MPRTVRACPWSCLLGLLLLHFSHRASNCTQCFHWFISSRTRAHALNSWQFPDFLDKSRAIMAFVSIFPQSHWILVWPWVIGDSYILNMPSLWSLNHPIGYFMRLYNIILTRRRILVRLKEGLPRPLLRITKIPITSRGLLFCTDIVESSRGVLVL